MRVVQATSGESPQVLIEIYDATVVAVTPVGAALEGALEGRTEEAIEKLRDIGQSIGEVCSSIRKASVEQMQAAKPDEFALEFGVKIGGEGSAIISKVSGEASIKITATWRAG